MGPKGRPARQVRPHRAPREPLARRRRRNGVASLTSILITLTIVLSLGLGALAAGTRAGRAFDRRRGR